jgi:hypothetical protein
MRLLRRQPASYLEVWSLCAGMLLLGVAVLLALGDTSPMTFAPLVVVMISTGVYQGNQLRERRRDAAVAVAWLASHPRAEPPAE